MVVEEWKEMIRERFVSEKLRRRGKGMKEGGKEGARMREMNNNKCEC